MALAAYDTILKHLKNNNETFADYDLILTGDLSIVGSCMLKKLFLETGLKLNNHADCGELIYNIKKQKVFSGGSGAACCPLVTYTYILTRLLGVYLKEYWLLQQVHYMHRFMFIKKDNSNYCARNSV